MRAAALAALAVAVGACGSEPQGVTVTEAPPVDARPAAPHPAPLDTVYADSLRFGDLGADSLAADTLGADTAAVVPDFRAFWPRFRGALEDGPPAVRPLVDLEVGSDPVSAIEGPFRTRALALTARDFRRDGTARDVTVRVGYDASGTIVPEDEAETEASVRLRFEVVDGAYRLVRVETAGRRPQ